MVKGEDQASGASLIGRSSAAREGVPWFGDCFDNFVAESFFGTLQLKLLDEHRWTSREHLALAIFDWIEAWYNPKRRHGYGQILSPTDYEAAHGTGIAETAA